MKASVTHPGLDPELAERLLERLCELRLCGNELSHSREANLAAIDKLLDNQPFYTLGIHAVIRAVEAGRLTREGVLGLVAEITKCSKDIGYTKGPNYISPAACLEGLIEGATLMREVRDRRGSVIFAAGHSGSMINCYNRLAEYFMAHGCDVPTPAAGTEVQKDWYLDYVGRVAVVSDTCGIHHTHMTEGMVAMLDGLPRPPALAICDHGFGGECINRRVPCVVPMDTNDPGFAVARHLGEQFVLVPLNDNRPNYVTAELAEIYITLIESL